MSRIVDPVILSKGKEVQHLYEFSYIEIVQDLNKIPYARIEILDGIPAQRKLPASDLDHFDLGQEIEVRLSYLESKKKASNIFKGIVVGHSIQSNEKNNCLVIDLKDKTFKMTNGRKNRVFENKADHQIIADLIKENGLKMGASVSVNYKHPSLVQYYCSDWDFLLSRADVNGLLVRVENGKIDLLKINKGQGGTVKLEYGIDDIYDYEMKADASGQFNTMQSVSWDVKKNKLSKLYKAKSPKLTQGNFNIGKIAKATSAKERTLQSAIASIPEEMQNWSNAAMAKSRMSLISGRLSIPGLAPVQIGWTLELNGVGKKFNGKTMISGIKHTVSVNGWDTDLQFGLSAKWFSKEEEIVAPLASGLLPAIHGLQIGIVDQFKADPEKQFRVKVLVPAINDPKAYVWARLANLDAGNDRGFLFVPEAGDEVVLGFLNDDPRQAIILGSLYSNSKKPPPEKLKKINKENDWKGIVSRGGINILFNDKKGNEQLIIGDKNKNEIILDKNGIKISSKKSIIIEGQKIDLK